MKNKQKIFLIIIMILITAVIGFFYLNNQGEKETVSPEEAIEQVEDDIIIDEPPVQIQQGQVTGIKDEKKEWVIEAGSITIAKDRESTIFKDIKKMVIFKEEEPHLTITAESCIANIQTKDMELRGNVIISTQEGDTLYGEKIFWYSDDKRISSNDEVELQVDDNHILAGGLFSNMEMTQLELTGGVTVIMKL